MFPTLAYLKGKDKVWRKVITHFIDFDLAFLYENSEVEKDLAPRAEGPLTFLLLLLKISLCSLIFLVFFMYVASIYFYAYPFFVIAIGLHFVTAVELLFRDPMKLFPFYFPFVVYPFCFHNAFFSTPISTLESSRQCIHEVANNVA